jgi:NAD(P)-dependent dehydrogenase (short-subunit alcohol dehydrogenase family)
VKVSELFDVRGKRVFITGGGSGIGLAIAEIMAGAGARIMLIDRDVVA